MFKRMTVLTLGVLLVVFLVAGCGGKKTPDAAPQGAAAPAPEVKATVLKMSVTTPDSSSWVKGANKFAELVDQKTGGKVKVQVFPNESLSAGNQGKGIEMLISGATDLSYHSNIIYSIMDEKFGVLSLPWLLPTYEKADAKVQGAGGKRLAELLSQKNVVALSFGENGFRQVTNNKRAITSPKDMAALKIRIPGIKMYMALYKALGADPTAMNFAEVFTALQQGTIDGQENPTDVINSAKLYEVQKHISLWNYSYDAIILGMNKDKFNTFDAATQQILRDAAVEASAFQRQLNRDNSAKQVEFFKSKGMTITELTADQIKAFQDAVAPVYTQYEPIMGKDLIDLFR